jgi:type IV secretion system protein VirB2
MKKISSFLARVALLSFFFVAMTPVLVPVFDNNLAQAQGTTTSADYNSNVLVSTMCNALKIITGNAGKGFAAFAIISVGIGFFTGKVSWGLMIGVAAGIAAMFGAPSIVSAITGKSAYDCGA